jgi:hypothetical protein
MHCRQSDLYFAIPSALGWLASSFVGNPGCEPFVTGSPKMWRQQMTGNLLALMRRRSESVAVAQCSGGLSRGVDERIRRGGALLQPPTCVLGDSIDIEQWFGIGRCSLRLCKLGLESMRVYARTRFFEDKLDQPFATELRGPSFW